MPSASSLATPSFLDYLTQPLSDVLMLSDLISQLPSTFPHLSLSPSQPPMSSGPRESGLCPCCPVRPHIPRLCFHLSTSRPDLESAQLSRADSRSGFCCTPNVNAPDPLSYATIIHVWRIPPTQPFPPCGQADHSQPSLSPTKQGLLHLLTFICPEQAPYSSEERQGA